MKKRKPEDYERAVRAVLAVLMAVAVCFIMRGAARMVSPVSSGEVEKQKELPCVVIDAGHGGADPGKVSVDGSLEKDINLKIALKLQEFLQMQDVEVILTRESDAGLYDESASNKKVQDMKNRVAVIEERQPALTVSIHQNSYHEEYVHGAQAFYYAGSDKSKELAERIQHVMMLELDRDNARQAKANDSYYLLKKTSSPIVIVECGFLSNYEEAQKLSSELYQEKVAWAIHMAIMQYLNSISE
ncbi:MAG: N-acetylmuramoyl-L-alanine amidase [Eubacterium sp.]|nr:N-acetylmuramoyl-L-alanine amidase [Eubacterium sp.]